MIKANNNIFKIIGFLVFFLTLSPISIYTSSFLEVIVYIILFALLNPLIKKNPFNSHAKEFIFFLLAFFVPIIWHMQTPFVTDILQWGIIFFLISTKNEVRVKILEYAIMCFSIILLLSIIEYIIGYITGISYTVAKNTLPNGAVFSQSIFNIYSAGGMDLQRRFQGLASEPGELAATCAFIIAFLPFEKKYTFPILINIIGGLLSLSLAFYIYFSFIIIYKISNKTLNISYLFILIFIFASSYVLFQDKIHEEIFLRVTEKEKIDNRTSDEVNKYIQNIFSSTNAIYGVGNRTAYNLQKNSEHGNAGLKWKLYQYGIVGVLFYFLAMYSFYRKYGNRNVPFFYGMIFFFMYFYSVGMWGIPIYMLLLFTTMPSQKMHTSCKHHNTITKHTKQLKETHLS